MAVRVMFLQPDEPDAVDLIVTQQADGLYTGLSGTADLQTWIRSIGPDSHVTALPPGDVAPFLLQSPRTFTDIAVAIGQLVHQDGTAIQPHVFVDDCVQNPVEILEHLDRSSPHHRTAKRLIVPATLSPAALPAHVPDVFGVVVANSVRDNCPLRVSVVFMRRLDWA
jgi:hypothetical protein